MSAGSDVYLVDVLSNAHEDVPERIEQITGRKPAFVLCDVREADRFGAIVTDVRPSAIVHCASLKSVSESVGAPERYFDVNVGGSLSVAQAWAESACETLVFSSSCTVYGAGDPPLTEADPLEPDSPYGWSKVMAERMFTEIALAHRNKSVANLRYFNPVGAHPSGLIGEAPLGPLTNLMPILTHIASESDRRTLDIYGTDYSTEDGTAIRDYVHVMDVAEAHVRSIDYLAKGGASGPINLGRGQGVSVQELVAAFEAEVGVEISTRAAGRRPGDVAEAWCEPSVARDALGWAPTRSLAEMCRDAWRFHALNQV